MLYEIIQIDKLWYFEGNNSESDFEFLTIYTEILWKRLKCSGFLFV